MTPVLLYDDKPLKAQGFATIFGREADTEVGTELIRQGAFAASLKSGQNVIATWGHDDGFTWAHTADGGLRLWETEVGLCFEATIESSLRGVGLADFVAQGAAVASITFTPLDVIRTATGREVVSARLTEICIFHEAVFPTAVWLAGDAQPETLTPRAQYLRRRWTAEPSSRRAYDKAIAATVAHTRRTSVSTTRVPTDEEIFGPAPGNMSMAEWLDFGQRCAHAARWMK